MRRIAVAVVVIAVIIGGAGVADQALGEPERIPLPEQGETVAASLSDGAPVFVSRDDEGGARVISAVSDHRLHLVEWCDDPGVFIERRGTTLFDPEGRWVNGPAPSGLARYDAQVEGETVVVGDLRGPQPRAERTDLPWHGVFGCGDGTGELATLPPELPQEVAVEDLPHHVGKRVVVEARAHIDEEGMRLCAHGRETCGPESIELASTWWPGYFDDTEGWEDGRYLVRVIGPRRVAELASAVGWEDEDPPDLVRLDLRPTGSAAETVWVRARLLAFDAAEGTVSLTALEVDSGKREDLLPETGRDGAVMLPLAHDDPQLVIERAGRLLHYYPEEFEAVVEAADDDVTVEGIITSDGEVRSLEWWRSGP